MDKELQEKARKREEHEQFAQDQLAHRRRMNMHYWKGKLDEARHLSATVNAELAKTKQQDIEVCPRRSLLGRDRSKGTHTSSLLSTLYRPKWS